MEIHPKEVGEDGIQELKFELDRIVDQYDHVLTTGAQRAGLFHVDDCFGDYIWINRTVIKVRCMDRSAYIAEMGTWDEMEASYNGISPSKKCLKKAVADIQQLFDYAAQEIEKPFEIQVVSK